MSDNIKGQRQSNTDKSNFNAKIDKRVSFQNKKLNTYDNIDNKKEKDKSIVETLDKKDLIEEESNGESGDENDEEKKES
jgi:hypothetical protein